MPINPFTRINFRIVTDLKVEKRVENAADLSTRLFLLLSMNIKGNREINTAASDAYNESW
ncbi:hypothetical protein MTHERMMSTA1_18690 [Methanosarcina thermophila MST-A1]|uniref:Putative RIH domain protein n=1 Tax=Methanosarcina thermophila TaxID=2210 RepID=A0A3G9CV49_METTE|nr:putative RIH domain protein [Methanosarcina thermophila]GLI14743.1 hypothetical protein MTHERMMSTA1_18690 [Methanosarcina thermophila MST-A1]